MHSIGVANRDIKPANVLVSNQHYPATSEELTTELLQTDPIRVYLTDFGEGRLNTIQTRTALSSNTTNVDRGTVPWMAPECLSGVYRLQSMNHPSLVTADVWSFGGLLHSMVNPNRDYPFDLECTYYSTFQNPTTLKEAITNSYDRGEHPIMSAKYDKQMPAIGRSFCAHISGAV